MTIQGHIENGGIVVDGPLALPNGTKVTVIVEPDGVGTRSAENLPSLYQRLQTVAGKAHGLPPDLAINHDHYLHGQPKRQ